MWPFGKIDGPASKPVPSMFNQTHLAVAQKTGTQNATLANGNMDHNLRNPYWFNFDHLCLVLGKAPSVQYG